MRQAYSASFIRQDFPGCASDVHSPCLIDITAHSARNRLTARRVFFLACIAVACTCIGVPIVGLGSMLSTGALWLIGLATAGIFVLFTVRSHRRHREKRARDTMEMAAKFGDSAASVEQLLATPGLIARNGSILPEVAAGKLQIIAEALACSRRSGLCVRIHDLDQQAVSQIEPLAVSFEPVALNEATGEIKAVLASQDASIWNNTPAVHDDGMEIVARVRRMKRLGMQFWVAVGYSLMFVMGIIGFYGTGRMNTMLILSVFSGPLSLYLGLRRRPHAEEHWAFPGGMRVGASAGEAHTFRRPQSVVFWLASSRMLVISDGVTTRDAAMTPAEVDFALRAWFCTAPGPTDEQLEGLLPTK